MNISPVRLHSNLPHYHGHTVRTLMLSSAVIMLVAETFWRELPFTVPAAIALIIVYVIAAGLTNKSTVWIHYANVILLIWSTFVFGSAAFVEGINLHRLGPLVNELLALIAIITLYFATKTLRGMLLKRAHTPTSHTNTRIDEKL